MAHSNFLTIRWFFKLLPNLIAAFFCSFGALVIIKRIKKGIAKISYSFFYATTISEASSLLPSYIVVRHLLI